MAKKPTVSRGVAAVALMALSKREFFQRLLDDPEGALADVRADLELSDDEVADVVSLIREGSRDITSRDALVLWDGWRATGKWGGVRPWPSFLPFWPMH
jgi:hypothetical protein